MEPCTYYKNVTIGVAQMQTFQKHGKKPTLNCTSPIMQKLSAVPSHWSCWQQTNLRYSNDYTITTK